MKIKTLFYINVIFLSLTIFLILLCSRNPNPPGSSTSETNSTSASSLSEAEIARIQADSLFDAKSYSLAGRAYQKADSLYLLEKNYEAALNVRADATWILYRQREWEEALDSLRSYRDQGEAKGLSQTLAMANILHKIGVIYSNKLKDKETAIYYYKKELELREKLGDPDKEGIVQVCRNIGNGYSQLESKDSADYYLTKAINYLVNHGPRINEKLKAQTYRLKGVTLLGLKDLHWSRKYLQAALPYYRDSERNPQKKAVLYNELALLYKDRKEYSEALQYCELAIEELRAIEDIPKEDLANCLNNKGLIYKDLNNPGEAEKYFFQALDLYRTIQGAEEQLAMVYNNLSIIYKHQKKYAPSVEYIRKSIQINKSLNNEVLLGKNFDNLGDVLVKEEKLQEALIAYDQAIAWFSRQQENLTTLTGEELMNLPNKIEIIVPLSSKARVYLDLFKDGSTKWQEIAYHQILILEKLIDFTRQDYQLQDSKSSLVEDTKPSYQHAIAVCLNLYDMTGVEIYFQKAFDLAEKSKAIILLEGIRDSKARLFNIPEKLLRRENKLKLTINQLEKAIRRQPADSPALVDLRDSLVKTRFHLRTLIDTFEANYHKYYELKYDLTFSPIRELQQNLSDHEGLIEYFVGASELYAFLITREQFTYKKISHGGNLVTWVDSLKMGLSGRFDPELNLSPRKSDSLYLTYAYRLHNILIAPLDLDPVVTNLILIPDDVLGYVPFEALIDRPQIQGFQEDFHNLGYLKDDYTISYNYSAAVMMESKEPAPTPPRSEILGFAPTQEDILLVEEGVALPDSFYFPKVNFVPEIQRLKRYFRGTYFVGPQASIQNFKKHAQLYSILHFAGHGKVNDREPQYSFLLFTPFSNPGDLQKSLFYVRDFYTMDLRSDLVVFTSCETAGGKVYRGEGIISLARATFYGGTKSLITTLWPIYAREKGDIIFHFYKNLSEGMPKDEAILAAKNEFLQNRQGAKAHPYYWASFVPYGNMEAIELPKKSGFLLGWN